MFMSLRLLSPVPALADGSEACWHAGGAAGVCEINTYFTSVLAMRPSSRNRNPATDLMCSKQTHFRTSRQFSYPELLFFVTDTAGSAGSAGFAIFTGFAAWLAAEPACMHAERLLAGRRDCLPACSLARSLAR